MTQAPPREGVPSCLRVTMFSDRAAGYTDAKICGHETFSRFSVTASTLTGLGRPKRFWAHATATLQLPLLSDPRALDVFTDDEAEAQAAWERAEHWVRTGELA